MALQQRSLGSGGLAAPSLRGASPPIRSLRSRRLLSRAAAANSKAEQSFNDGAELQRGVWSDFVDIDGGRTVGFSRCNRAPEDLRLAFVDRLASVHNDNRIWRTFAGPRDLDHARPWTRRQRPHERQKRHVPIAARLGGRTRGRSRAVSRRSGQSPSRVAVATLRSPQASSVCFVAAATARARRRRRGALHWRA